MKHSKCVVPSGTTERERDDGESRTIVDLGVINDSREAVGQKCGGPSEGIEGEDRPGKAPRSEAGLGASLKPVKAKSYEMVRRFIQQRQKGQGCRIGLWSERKSINDAVARIPTSLGANSVVQHLHATPDPKLCWALL
jgi:hypothetical protein